MGQSESTDPGLMQGSSNYFALIFKPLDKLKIVNAGKDVVHIFEKILCSNDMISSSRYKGSTLTHKIRLHGTPFSPGGASTVDLKIAFLKILNHLYHELRLYPFVSSDMSLETDTSTVFFKKKVSGAEGNYVCIAPSGTDSLDLIDIPSNVQTQIINVLESSWGINPNIKEKRHNCTRVELNGRPWGHGASGENATIIRRLLLKLIETMKFNSYSFKANISMKGTCDILFFQYDPTIVPDSSQVFIMYLSKRDRIRFIDAPQHVIKNVRSLINQTWKGGITNECIHNEAVEFKLKGNPWHAHSYDAAPSRLLISTIFVKTRQNNVKCIGTLDISRRSDDKSIFLFECSPQYALPPSVPIRWTCFYFCGRNKLMLIGVHNDIVGLLDEHLSPIVRSNGTYEGNLYLWRFNDNVFSYGYNSSREILYVALIRIYDTMKSQGWELVSSADVSSILIKRNDNWVSYDAHSWYFINTAG